MVTHAQQASINLFSPPPASEIASSCFLSLFMLRSPIYNVTSPHPTPLNK